MKIAFIGGERGNAKCAENSQRGELGSEQLSFPLFEAKIVALSESIKDKHIKCIK